MRRYVYLILAGGVFVAPGGEAADIIPLHEQVMYTAAAGTLRAEPGHDAGAVAPLRPGEAVIAVASTYVTVRKETAQGHQTIIEETTELWYKIKTADGFTGWVESTLLRFGEGAPGK